MRPGVGTSGRVLLVVAAVAAFAVACGRRGGARGTRFENDRYSVDLPPGWKVLNPGSPGAPVTFGDADGRYFAIETDPAERGLGGDGRWDVRAARSGDQLEIAGEDPPCALPPGVTLAEAIEEDGDEGCLAGDGRLDLFAVVDPAVRSHTYLLLFGHSERERDVDLAPFRAMLLALRFK